MQVSRTPQLSQCVVSPSQCVALTISYHLYFLRISKVSTMLVTGQICVDIFFQIMFLLFFIKKFVILSFLFLFLIKYQIFATECQSVRNRNWLKEIVSGTISHQNLALNERNIMQTRTKRKHLQKLLYQQKYVIFDTFNFKLHFYLTEYIKRYNMQYTGKS